MRLVVDTNRIIAVLIKNSTSRRIINHLNAELLAIPFSEKEIGKYKKIILEKAKITEIELNFLMKKLHGRMVVLDDKIILSKMNEAVKIMDDIDPDDTPFIAAALATNSDIWSDDTHFEKQKKVKIWKTKDLVRKL